MKRVRDTTPTLEHALEDVRVLVERTLTALETTAPSADERGRRLEPAELPSLVLYAGVLVRSDPQQRETAIASLARDPAQGPGPRLKRADLLEMTKKRPEPPELARDMVELYVLLGDNITSRARYNVACFYSNLGKDEESERSRSRCYDRALSELALALNDATLLTWAQLDPSLQPVQRARPADWAALVARHTPEPHPLALDGGVSTAPPTEAPTVAGERPSLRDQMLRDFMRRSGDEAADVTAEPTTGIDYEIRTPAGVILMVVEPRRYPPVRRDEIRRFVRELNRWAARHDEVEPWRAVLLTNAFAEQDARNLADEFDVEIVTVWSP